MRRSFTAWLVALALISLVPSAVLAGKPLPTPTTNAISYLGRVGDLVDGGETAGVWNARSGSKDAVVELALAPTTANDLMSIKVTTVGGYSGTWDTVAANAAWGLGVTTRERGKLLNAADTSITTMDLDNGLRLYLHAEPSWYWSGTLTVYACSDAACQSPIATMSMSLP